jgi:hypothetical protein
MASLQVPVLSAKPQVIRKTGELLPLTSEDAYRAAIHRWNEAFIKEAVMFHILTHKDYTNLPMQSIIVFCESDEDVSTCLHYVQEWDLDLAVASGRHTYSGASSTSGFVIGNLIFHPETERTSKTD